MVAATRPIRRTTRNQDPLMSTGHACRQLKVPGRTLRRWVQQRGLGTMVGGRTVLTRGDLQLLRLLRDGDIS